MYTSFFGLNEKPFAITPDPRYLYLSERHAEALAHLLYGITESGGFVQLTGEVGTGKTTLVRSSLERFPEHAEAALILNPRLSPIEFLKTICEELHVPSPSDTDSAKELIDALNGFLLEAHSQNRRIILIVDEAQNLSTEVLEQVRLLTNLETAKQKLLQILLIGQPELRELLERDSLRQLDQRITGRYHLEPLAPAETFQYIRHRLQVAGATTEIFTRSAMAEIHRLSGGIPRVINVISDRALLGAFTMEQHQVDAPLARRAASEVFGKPVLPRWFRWTTAAVAAAAIATIAVIAWLLAPRADQHSGLAVAQDRIVETTDDGAGVDLVLAKVEPAAVGPGTDPPASELEPQLQPTVEESPSMVEIAAADDTIPLAELLTDYVARTGTDPAFAELFALWGAEYVPDDQRPCEQAVAQGLSCVYKKGTLAELRVLNRPAILSLTDDTGTEHQLALAGLDDRYVRFQIDGEYHDVSLGDLSRYWFGDYLLLWRPPTDPAQTLAIGTRGSGVLWLRRSLASIEGSAGVAETDFFDNELADRVRAFQRQHRLNVDGIAGVQTQIVLNTELGLPETPSLSEGR